MLRFWSHVDLVWRCATISKCNQRCCCCFLLRTQRSHCATWRSVWDKGMLCGIGAMHRVCVPWKQKQIKVLINNDANVHVLQILLTLIQSTEFDMHTKQQVPLSFSSSSWQDVKIQKLTNLFFSYFCLFVCCCCFLLFLLWMLLLPSPSYKKM